MKNKRNRIQVITDLLRTTVIGSQEELLSKLAEKNFVVTQATLSRDLKLMKVSKMPLSNGNYRYVLPSSNKPFPVNGSNTYGQGIILSLDFSGQFGVLKTKPGYASPIAWEIDGKVTDRILGTIAGDDSILIIPQDGVSREEITRFLQDIFMIK